MLILGGSRLQVPAIEAAQRLGFSVLCADRDPDAVGFDVADACSLTSTLDAVAIERLALEEEASYVITSTSDAPVRVAALVSENRASNGHLLRKCHMRNPKGFDEASFCRMRNPDARLSNLLHG